MADWIPMFTLPNITLTAPIETDGVALVSTADPRIGDNRLHPPGLPDLHRQLQNRVWPLAGSELCLGPQGRATSFSRCRSSGSLQGQRVDVCHPPKLGKISTLWPRRHGHPLLQLVFDLPLDAG